MIQEWGFNCSCSLCASGEAVAISDRQRARIRDILRAINQSRNQKHEIVSQFVLELLELCDKEGLTAQVGDFHSIIAGVYASMGDVDLASKHGELAVLKLRHYAGRDSERTERAVLFLEKLAFKTDQGSL